VPQSVWPQLRNGAKTADVEADA